MQKIGEGLEEDIDIESKVKKVKRFLNSQGWQYVLRTAKNTLIEAQNGEIFNLGAYYPDTTTAHFWLPDIYFSEHRYGTVNCLVWYHKSYESPIYLVPNLEYAPDIMAFYKKLALSPFLET